MRGLMVTVAIMISCQIRSDLGQARSRDCVLIIVVCWYASINTFLIIDAKILMTCLINHDFMMG